MKRRRKIMSVVGTRPNFMKIAPIARELERRAGEFEHVLAHTGQHYDDEMSKTFIDELSIGEPDYFLGVGSGSRAQQLARTIERLEPVLLEVDPVVVIVAGDVNSTLGAALAGEAVGIPVAHIEAGLRSFDRTLPEETNRVIVDMVSQLLFTHSPEARENLLAEGSGEASIHYVGNTLIDTLVALRNRIDETDAPARHGLTAGSYVVVTLHRHWLFEQPALLEAALRGLASLSAQLPVVFPMHPRTQATAEELGLVDGSTRLRFLPALGYLEFLGLVAEAAGVITDSGGVQEETTFLGIPCFTFRPNTERPVTVDQGTNVILGLDPARIDDVPRLLAERSGKPRREVPHLWDGRAAERIVSILAQADFAAMKRGR